MIRFFMLFFVILFLSPVSQAQEKIENQNITFDEWASLPILYDGRIMPIDSFSNIVLKKISGDTRADANALLANIIFEPDNAIFHPIFSIKDATRYDLEPKQFYNFTIVSDIINKNKKTIDMLLFIPEKKLSIEQKNLLDLYGNYGLYNQLLRSMTGLIPINIQGKENPKTYLDLKLTEDQTVPTTPEANILAAASRNNILFKIIPENEDKNNFLSPWDILRQKNINQYHLTTLYQWQSATIAYREQDGPRWNKAINSLKNSSGMDITRLEKKYNDWSLIQMAFILFCISITALILSTWIDKSFITKISFISLGLGSVAVTIDIILRIIITHRPPVGTLYESILFVTIITSLTAFLYCLKKIHKTSLFIGSISGVLLLIIANAFVGIDSFSPLVAVLNTDFWLATHVIIITAGYGFCLLVSLYAHIIMWNQNYNKKNPPYKNMNVLVILSLLFVTVGTILGGLWADQSWGRFWGWDPKENGAMLIALWIIWLLHGKITKDMTTKYYMAGMAFLSVIVALAWFGVNLLSVGLHSYGFISGIALGLVGFCAFQTAVILYLLYGRPRTLNKKLVS